MNVQNLPDVALSSSRSAAGSLDSSSTAASFADVIADEMSAEEAAVVASEVWTPAAPRIELDSSETTLAIESTLPVESTLRHAAAVPRTAASPSDVTAPDGASPFDEIVSVEEAAPVNIAPDGETSPLNAAPIGEAALPDDAMLPGEAAFADVTMSGSPAAAPVATEATPLAALAVETTANVPAPPAAAAGRPGSTEAPARTAVPPAPVTAVTPTQADDAALHFEESPAETSGGVSARRADLPANPPSTASAAPAAPVDARSVTASMQAAPAPTPRPHLLPQLSTPVLALARAADGEHSVTLTVSPETLGPVTVRARIGAGGIRLELHAATDAGREALRAILTDLRRDLAVAAPGSSLSVSSDAASSGSPERDHSSDGRTDTDSGARHGAPPETTAHEHRARSAGRPPATLAPVRPLSPHGGIDLYA